MPTVATAVLLVRINGGSPTYGGITANPGDLIQLVAESYAGWGSPAPRWEITSYAPGWSTPAGWTKDATSGIIYYLGISPPSFLLPTTMQVAAGLFGVWRFRLTVNGGGSTALVDKDRTSIQLISLNGVVDTGFGERTEFDQQFSHASKLWTNNRLLDGAVAGGGGGGLVLGVGTPTACSASPGVQGTLGTAARFDHNHEVLTGSPVAIGTSLSDGVSGVLAKADHVHTLPESVLRAVAATLTTTLTVNNQRIGSLATPVAATDAVTKGYADGLVSFTNIAAALAGATTNVDLNGVRLVNIGDPTSSADATTKGFEDEREYASPWKIFVRGASTGPQLLSGGLTEDGITYADGDLYLAKDQAGGATNGVYVVNTGGAWTRHASMSTDDHVANGVVVGVRQGTTNGGTGWVLSTPSPITLNTTPLTFTKIWGPGLYSAGNGLTLTGTTFAVQAAGDGSIAVGVGGVGVGVLASDTQHGSRGGGSQHALAVAGSPGVAGFIGGVDLAALQSRTTLGTPDTMMLRDGDGGVEAVYLASPAVGLLPAAKTKGLVRGVNQQVIVAARNAADDADLEMLSVDTDALKVGFESTQTSIYADKPNGVHLISDGAAKIVARGEGVGFFGVGDFASGDSIISIQGPSTPPTDDLAGDVVNLYVYDGVLYGWSSGKVSATVVPKVSGPAGTLIRIDTLIARASTNAGDPSFTLIDIPIGAANAIAQLDITLLAKSGDASLVRRRLVVLNNEYLLGAVATDTIGTDVNTIGDGTAVSFGLSGSNYRISATPANTLVVKWAVFVRIVYSDL